MENNDYNVNDESNLPLYNNDGNAFDLPSDYFALFEDKIRKKLETQEELNEFPLLSSIPKDNLFTTPADYFATEESRLEIKVELSAYTQLQSIKPLVPADLDAEYISHLQSAINYKIELAEELKSYQRLYYIDKTNSFIVPDTYFEYVAQCVRAKIYSEKGNKTSVLDLVLDFIFGKKAAFAFGLVIIVSLSIYFYQSTETIIESGDCKTLACLERQEILNNNKAISNFDEDQLMDLVDVNSLNKQLNSDKEKSTILPGEKLNVDSVSEEDLLDEL